MSDGSVTFDGNPVTLAGDELNEGDHAPEFAVTADLGQQVEFDKAEASEAVHLVTTGLSIDTPVCATQFRKFDERAQELDEAGVRVWYITRDLPFALQRNAEEMGVENLDFLSDYRAGEFGDRFGLVVDEFGLLARATFVIDRDGKVIYREICSDIANEPDYDAAVDAALEVA